uniref:Si:ch211-129c21.1 n=1 Tax=Cyprinus carpio TaxID=7962 RepID=A0A8C1ZRR8_CYPCA
MFLSLDNNVITFKEEGVWNYSTMLIREDLGLLVLGAREAVYALDINNISVAKSKVLWKVTEEKQKECTSKGKHPDIDCRNYVRMLHQMNGSVMYMCGTNAFSPTCDYMTYGDGQLKLEGKQEDGRGKCPFDPFQRSASVMAGMYSMSFFFQICFNYAEITLIWTVNVNYRSSTVCAYDVTDISKVFSRGKFKTEVTVEMSDVKWVTYNGELPVPRPGACINNAARSSGIMQSLDIPDKTLQFIRDRPLMDDAVRPITGKPLLLKRGPLLTRLVVDHVTVSDGESYHVMFVGTENGYVQKAVNYDGEMHIIEEVKLFQNAEPIEVLRLHQNQLYAGSASGVVQMPVSNCSRYSSCLDCVLARDPYCAWDLTSNLLHFSNLIQSLKDGDATRCPTIAKFCSLVLGNNIRLPCYTDSNLAQVNWNFAGKPLPYSNRKYIIYNDGILIYNASAADAGRYISVVSKWIVMQVALAVLSVMMACLLIWNLYMGHISPFMCCGRQSIKSHRDLPEREYMHTGNDAVDSKQQMVRLCVTTNSGLEAPSFHRNTTNGDTPTDACVFKYITDESEI